MRIAYIYTIQRNKPTKMTTQATSNTQWFDNPSASMASSLARTNRRADRLRIIEPAINNYQPQSFAAKPFVAVSKMAENGWDVVIICSSTQTGEHIYTFLMSEFDHFDADIAADEMITELIDLQISEAA